MCAAVDLERQLACGRRRAARPRAPKSSRCSVLEITPGCAGAAAGRAAAARPARRRPTRCRPAARRAVSRPRTPASRLGVERFGVERQRAHARSAGFVQELLEDQRRGRRVEVARRPRRAPRSVGVALVDLVHRQAEARRAAAAEAARARAYCRAAAPSGWNGHADDQRRRLPFGDQPRDASKRASPSAATVQQRRGAARSANCRSPTPTRRRRRNRKRERSGRRERQARRSAHACPASELSMRGVDAEQRQRLVVALARPACRR